MTTRLYYDDSEALSFEAEVLACAASGVRFEVTLDRTAFYPTSGGQPFDTGQLGPTAVVDVIDRDDGTIAHVVAEPVAIGSRVTGVIDAVRRRDHMEQHTGQHILSAALDRQCGVATVGFHMGTDVSTIDLDREVSPDELERSESLANDVVRENRTVTAQIVAAPDVGRLPLRRAPTRAGDLRIVEVDDFDVSACGGTHVRRTGAIGQIAVVGVEKVRGATRVSFVCGGRALGAFRARRERLADVARLLGVGELDVVPHVQRVLQESRDRDRALRAARTSLVQAQAAAWRGEAETIGPWRVVLRATGFDAADLKALAQTLVESSGILAIVTGSGSPLPIVVARGRDVPFDAGAFIKAATARFGGRGGGRPELAQGGVPAAVTDVENFVRRHLEQGNNGE